MLPVQVHTAQKLLAGGAAGHLQAINPAQFGGFLLGERLCVLHVLAFPLVDIGHLLANVFGWAHVVGETFLHLGFATDKPLDVVVTQHFGCFRLYGSHPVIEIQFLCHEDSFSLVLLNCDRNPVAGYILQRSLEWQNAALG